MVTALAAALRLRLARANECGEGTAMNNNNNNRAYTKTQKVNPTEEEEEEEEIAIHTRRYEQIESSAHMCGSSHIETQIRTLLDKFLTPVPSSSTRWTSFA